MGLSGTEFSVQQTLNRKAYDAFFQYCFFIFVLTSSISALLYCLSMEQSGSKSVIALCKSVLLRLGRA